MAYAAVVTVTRRGSEILVTVAETEAATGSEATITIAVEKFRVHRQLCQLDSGTGTTIDPILARSSGGTGIDIVLQNDAAAASVDNSITAGAASYVSGGVLYHKSVVDAGTDNAVTTEYYLTVGW